MSRKPLIDLLMEGEAALGENLVWLSDQLDQSVRQKDPETLRRLAQLNSGWIAIVKAHQRVANEGEAMP